MIPFKPKNILITGGAGFIGAHFINFLLQKYADIKIINLDKLTYAADLNRLQKANHHQNYHFIKADIGSAAAIEDTMRRYQINTIVNFAAETHVDNSIENPEIFVKTNVLGTHNLLVHALHYWRLRYDLSPAHCRFHQISTDEVYGPLGPNTAPFTESAPLAPSSPYAASKASADHLVNAYHKTYQLPISISRCSNNYGSHQHFEKFIPKIIKCCLTQQTIPIYSDGSNVRDWIAVADHCSALDRILHAGDHGSCYNIGANNEWNNLAITKLICHYMDNLMPHHAPHSHLIRFVSDRPGHDFRYAIDSSLLQLHLNWRAVSVFEETLLAVVQKNLQAVSVL